MAARRILLNLGGPRYTPLYIALVARTSLWAKSTTADIGVELLRAAGLDWLLAADAATPQKFIRDLTVRLPDDYDRFSPERRQRVHNRLALAGQRGWFYEEFGQQLHSISRQDGIMADFRGILRRFDDCKARYEYASLGRGEDVVEQPYLALLAGLTPADLGSMGRRGASAWADGFWARFALVAPGDRERNRGRFPEGERSIPLDLIDPLQRWHSRLGMPAVKVTGEGSASGRAVEVQPLRPGTCTFEAGVSHCYYAYSEALLNLIDAGGNPDLDGNYARLAEKALRIAILLASLDNGNRVELRHWARGQAVAERWRADLHRLYAQLNAGSNGRSPRDRILETIQNRGDPTRREIAQYTKGIEAAELETTLRELVAAGDVLEYEAGRTTRYSLRTAKVRSAEV